MYNLYISVYRKNNFYRVGFVGDCLPNSVMYPIRHNIIGYLTRFQKAYLIWSGKIVHATVDEQIEYRKEYTKNWWCRCMHWRPYWGELTKNHAKMMNELRQYWMERWYGIEKPDIFKKLHDCTPLNSDNISIIVDYLPYPYQVKRF